MPLNKFLVSAAAFVAVVGLVFWTARPHTLAPTGTACTMEAKLCPDGSYVGRTGPNCEFAACPGATSTPNAVSLQAHFGEQVTGLGVHITPLALLEDSRCPVDVQCIQAGTVRIRATLVSGLGTATEEFKLGQTITTEAETVTLVSVLPVKKEAVSLKASDYVFTFEVKKRAAATTGAGIAPYTSGVQGTVSLGPTCPVERMPPEPSCADKPYATTIVVHRLGANTVFATATSDAAGGFKISLPPGSYTLTAGNGSMLPRCTSVMAEVGSTGYVTANISCDTGIR
jgi:hypothetical protein